MDFSDNATNPELRVVSALVLNGMQREQTVEIAVGTSVARRPPHGSVRALFSAHGSYRRCLASKRKLGYG